MLTLPDGTTAAFHAEDDAPPPTTIVPADDRMSAKEALRHVRGGAHLLWTGDYHNGRQLLGALKRRVRDPRIPPDASLAQRWQAERDRTGAVAERVGRVLIVVDPDGSVPLRRAPDTREAVALAFGLSEHRRVVPLRTLIGALGAAGWTRAGLDVPGLKGRIVPRYGVFSPTRSAYVGLMRHLDFTGKRVLDTGCGTGVLGFVALQRGAAEVLATDVEPRAVGCAQDNAERLGLADRFRVGPHDLFWPEERVDLALFNPPWMPGVPRTRLDRAVYDADGVVRRWLAGLPTHLREGGRGALLLSDLAVRIGLRDADAVTAWSAEAGLEVVERHDAPATHKKARNTSDPLHAARAVERIELWVLRAR